MTADLLKLNIGCGSDHKTAPWVNCDYHHVARPDKLFDFGKDEWPFPDGSCDEILAKHCLEHLEHGRHLNHVMREAYRVLIPGGRFTIAVPHPRSDYFVGDPTHSLPITNMTLDLYSMENCRQFAERGLANTPLAVQCKVDFRMILPFEQEVNEHWGDRLLTDDKKGVRNQEDFEMCVRTFNNVLDAMTFVLERV